MDPQVLSTRLYKSESEKEALDLSAEDLGSRGGAEIVAAALASVRFRMLHHVSRANQSCPPR